MLLGTRTNTGATPADAVKNYVYGPTGRALHIKRVNIAAPYAIVVSNGEMEGAPAGPILVQRFRFGWQTISEVRAQCMLTLRGITVVAIKALLDGIMIPKVTSYDCDANWKDRGDPKDIESIRSQMRDPYLVPSVQTVGNYAIADWYGAGGGQLFFGRLPRDNWVPIFGGGGAYRSNELAQEGVPLSVACLLLADKSCPGKYAAATMTSKEQQETVLIRYFYLLWNEKQFNDMYKLLSAEYRLVHPFASWIKQHKRSERISILQAWASGDVVTLKLSSEGISFDPSCPENQRQTDETYSGVWQVVTEKAELKMASADLRLNLHRSRCRFDATY